MGRGRSTMLLQRRRTAVMMRPSGDSKESADRVLGEEAELAELTPLQGKEEAAGVAGEFQQTIA